MTEQRQHTLAVVGAFLVFFGAIAASMMNLRDKMDEDRRYFEIRMDILEQKMVALHCKVAPEECVFQPIE